ncbi:hypothetical protein C8J57DRAFT_1509261 [Mycena rebaudengoi]|nr:hypothetical protein C8J57DRAFT_1509261 [Mycena rebaudengoi]
MSADDAQAYIDGLLKFEGCSSSAKSAFEASSTARGQGTTGAGDVTAPPQASQSHNAGWTSMIASHGGGWALGVAFVGLATRYLHPARPLASPSSNNAAPSASIAISRALNVSLIIIHLTLHVSSVVHQVSKYAFYRLPAERAICTPPAQRLGDVHAAPALFFRAPAHPRPPSCRALNPRARRIQIQREPARLLLCVRRDSQYLHDFAHPTIGGVPTPCSVRCRSSAFTVNRFSRHPISRTGSRYIRAARAGRRRQA